jgi:polar amino acid transport system substrate-binding protein
LLAVLLLLAGVGSYAQESTVRVVTEAWPPFRITETGSRFGYTGIDIDILLLLEEDLGVELIVERHPFARCLAMIGSGDADLIIGIAYTDERDEYIEYVPTSYFEVRPAFYTQTGRGAEIERYEDLYEYSVGYSLDSAYFEPFNSDERLRKVGVSTEAQLLQLVALGRIDVTIGTEPNIGYDIALSGLADALEPTVYRPEVGTPLYFGISPHSPLIDRREEIDLFVRNLLDSPELAAIRERYR